MTWTRDAVILLISAISLATGADEAVMQCIVARESSYHVWAVGRAGEIGLAQYMPETHEWLADISGLDVVLGEPYDDLRLLAWALQNGYEWLWSTWPLCEPKGRFGGGGECLVM